MVVKIQLQRVKCGSKRKCGQELTSRSSGREGVSGSACVGLGALAGPAPHSPCAGLGADRRTGRKERAS